MTMLIMTSVGYLVALILENLTSD